MEFYKTISNIFRVRIAHHIRVPNIKGTAKNPKSSTFKNEELFIFYYVGAINLPAIFILYKYNAESTIYKGKLGN